MAHLTDHYCETIPSQVRLMTAVTARWGRRQNR